jgi:hypothetical protein
LRPSRRFRSGWSENGHQGFALGSLRAIDKFVNETYALDVLSLQIFGGNFTALSPNLIPIPFYHFTK